MPVAIIAGVVAGAGAIGGALISSHAVNNASNDAANAAAANNALQEKIYNSNVALAQPFISGGTNAENELQGFLGLGGDPAKINAAFNTYLNSTGYQFNRQQGLDAVTQSKAVSGLLDSGSALKALDAYGTGIADQYGQQYVGNLQNLSDTGQRAAGSLTELPGRPTPTRWDRTTIRRPAPPATPPSPGPTSTPRRSTRR